MKFFLPTKTKFLKASAIFMIGLIFGAAGINAIISQHLDNLHRENFELSEKLAAVESELEEVKVSLKEKRYTVVSIDPLITFTDELTDYEKKTAALEIQKEIKEKLQSLIGKEVSNLNYYLIPTVIDDREIEIDGKSYHIKVKMVVVTQKILIYVDVQTE